MKRKERDIKMCIRDSNNDVRTVSQQGRLESLEILEEIYRGHDGGYFDESSVANEYIQGQTQMFLRNGLIIACGDWFSTEMRELAADYAAEGYTAVSYTHLRRDRHRIVCG